MKEVAGIPIFFYTISWVEKMADSKSKTTGKSSLAARAEALVAKSNAQKSTVKKAAPAKAPAKTAAKAPVKAAPKAPAKTAAKAPAKSPAKAPAKPAASKGRAV